MLYPPHKYIRMPKLKVNKALAMITCLGIFCALQSAGQDVHFTQFFTNPILINPAQTGNYNGNYRIGFNAKMQWPWAIAQRTYNYHTEAPYIDFSFLENKLRRGWMGIGAVFLNDEAGDGLLTYRRFGLSYAYHQSFDRHDKYVLSAGIIANYIIRSVDYSKLYFNNQWVDDEGFDLSINPAEPYQRQTFGMFDLGAGIQFSAQVHKQLKLHLGFSMLHINMPKHSFYNNNERLGIRHNLQAGAVWQLSDRWSTQADFNFSYQKKAMEILFGAMAGYSPGKIKNGIPFHTVYAGLYYRTKDAISPVVGYQISRLRILLNYDVVLSKLLVPGKGNGGPEVSLVYIGSWTKSYNGRKTYCPRF